MSISEQQRAAERYAIEGAEMDRLSEIVAMIPDVKPRLAMQALRQAIENGTHGAGSFDGRDRSLAWRDGWVQKTSPVGARVLVALFRDGKIKQNPPRSRDILGLETYSATETAFRSKVARKLADWEASEARLDEIAANPDLARPDEITAGLIDQIFLRRLGYGKFGSMRIGGLECHKQSTGAYLSNSGKTRYSGEVYCWWIDEDGNRRGQDKPETHPNRRNDPERNWGLGRE